MFVLCAHFLPLQLSTLIDSASPEDRNAWEGYFFQVSSSSSPMLHYLSDHHLCCRFCRTLVLPPTFEMC